MIPGIVSSMGFAAPVATAYSGGSLDTQTVTSGVDGTAINENRRKGFILSALGSINDGASNLYSGATIRELASEENASGFDVIFSVSGVQTNSGWSTMTVDGLATLNRASAAFSTSGGNSTWTWDGAGSLFGSSGSTHVVGFS